MPARPALPHPATARRDGVSPRARSYARRLASVDGRDVGTDQLCGLLVNAALTTSRVILLKMRKSNRRGDRIHLVLAMVVERHVHEGIIREPEDDVAHVVGLV